MAVRLSSEMRSLAHELRYEPTPRRIRADAGGVTLVDSQNAFLVFEPRKLTPVFAVPEADIAADLLDAPAGRPGGGPRSSFAAHTAEGQVLTLRNGDLELPEAGFRVAEADLAGHILLDFGAFDQWREEDEVVEGHPRDPFHRMDARASSRRVRVGYGTTVLAESVRPVFVYETMLPVRTYLPREDVDFGVLERTPHSTICPYKGAASYWSVTGGGSRGENIAWSYESPLQDALQLEGLIAFYDKRTIIDVERMTEEQVLRKTVTVNGTGLSYLEAGTGSGTPLLLLHGTFWSRVWLPVLPALAAQGRCVALDLPGFGASSGELDIRAAAVPKLAEIVLAAAEALGLDRFDLAGHDIGGGIAQHLTAASGRVRRLVLMNSVMFDSWPVPAVERFRDPEVRAGMGVNDMVAARAETTRKAVSRELSDDEVADYVSPWKDPARVRSWMAMAAAADARYTLELVPALKAAAVPTRLVWGGDDDFQKISFARRYATEIPATDLVEVPGKHIPTEDSPGQIAAAIAEHLA